MSLFVLSGRRGLFVLALGLVLAACDAGEGGPGLPVSDDSNVTNPGDTGDTGDTGGDSGSDSGDVGDGDDTGDVGDADGDVGGTALLTWTAPTKTEDGSCLGELAEYMVSYGLASGHYTEFEAIKVADLSAVDTGQTDECGKILRYSYQLQDLSTASWHFAVQALDMGGNISDYSNEVIKTVQ